MNEIDKRAKEFAEYWEENVPKDEVDRSYILAEAVEDELDRDGLSFEEKIIVVRKAFELIEIQKTRTKKERLNTIWKSRAYFTNRGINSTTGKKEVFWDVEKLEAICQNEGLQLQEALGVLQKKIKSNTYLG